MPTSVIGFTFSGNAQEKIMYMKNIIFNLYDTTEVLSCKGFDNYLNNTTILYSYTK